jgi:hypothetical protein
VWKAHLLGQWGVVFSGAAGTAFAYERERADPAQLVFWLPRVPKAVLAPHDLLQAIVDAQGAGHAGAAADFQVPSRGW